MEIEVEPSEFDVEMLSMPAIVANCFMSGVATEVAIVSGEAPGREADTLITGNSACGRAATGKSDQANRPPMIIATDISIVATGLRIQNSDIVMTFRLTTGRYRIGRAGITWRT
jgi:hypothetical protein